MCFMVSIPQCYEQLEDFTGSIIASKPEYDNFVIGLVSARLTHGVQIQPLKVQHKLFRLEEGVRAGKPN